MLSWISFYNQVRSERALTNASQIRQDWDAQALQGVGWPDATDHQHLGRLESTSGQDDLLVGVDGERYSCCSDCHTGSLVLRVEKDFLRHGHGVHVEVTPTAGQVQERGLRRISHLIRRVDCRAAVLRAVEGSAIEIFCYRDTDFIQRSLDVAGEWTGIVGIAYTSAVAFTALDGPGGVKATLFLKYGSSADQV